MVSGQPYLPSVNVVVDLPVFDLIYHVTMVSMYADDTSLLILEIAAIGRFWYILRWPQ